MTTQFELPLDGVELPHAQAFERWKASEGGNWILQRCFHRAAFFGRIFKKIEARAGFHSPAWESARFYCVTEQVFITDHTLIVTNWDAATNVYFTTNRFISNVYTWSNAASFTNTWTELVPSGSLS